MNQLKATKPEELCAHQIHTKYYSYRMINRAKQLKKSKSKYSKMTEYLEFQMLSELEPVQTDFILNWFDTKKLAVQLTEMVLFYSNHTGVQNTIR